MTETSEMELISRRRIFRVLGLAALALAATPALLTVSDAEAQGTAPATPSTQTPQAPTTPQTGTERRQERRTERTQRRQERRTARTERRQERRTARTERRENRRGTTAKAKAAAPQ